MAPPARTSEPHHADTTHAPRSIRRTMGLVLGTFVALQVLVALAVSFKARARRRWLTENRPPEHPWRAFEPITLEHREDRMQLYMHGPSVYDAMVEAIDAATGRVYVETFIWVDDGVAERIRDALGRAAERGVDVRVLWDWWLSTRGMEEGYFPKGVDARPFKPIPLGPAAMRPSNLLRDHRKLVVVDGCVAFCGGYNFGEEYRGWRDTHLRIEGASVGDIENAFVDFWNQHRPLYADRLEVEAERTWDPHVLVHRNDPSLAIFPIRGMYLEAIDRATERVWITTAYFVPDKTFVAALVEAARRGVDVRVLMPAVSNHPLTDALAHGTFDDLLTVGVRIFLYRQFMVHAKTCVIDSEWSTVGTANIDRWSMLGNYEVNLEIRSARLAAQLEEMFEFDCEHAFEVHLDAWRRRPIQVRGAERMLRSLAPLM